MVVLGFGACEPLIIIVSAFASLLEVGLAAVKLGSGCTELDGWHLGSRFVRVLEPGRYIADFDTSRNMSVILTVVHGFYNIRHLMF